MNTSNCTTRILSSCQTNFNSPKVIDPTKNFGFNKVDNDSKSKLVDVASSGNLFQTNNKNDLNKIFYKTLYKKVTSGKLMEDNISNDCIHIKNDFIKQSKSKNISINEYVFNFLN